MFCAVTELQKDLLRICSQSVSKLHSREESLWTCASLMECFRPQYSVLVHIFAKVMSNL